MQPQRLFCKKGCDSEGTMLLIINLVNRVKQIPAINYASNSSKETIGYGSVC